MSSKDRPEHRYGNGLLNWEETISVVAKVCCPGCDRVFITTRGSMFCARDCALAFEALQWLKLLEGMGHSQQ